MQAKGKNWFLDPNNMHGREVILMHRLCFDLQLAAARSGYYLNTYYDDVDHDGFDIIFDDKDTLKKTQVKSLDVQSKTQTWKIRKGLLRPAFEHLDVLGFESSPEGEGVDGGVILIKFDASVPEFPVRYFFTDLMILLAFECQLIRRKHASSRAAIDDWLKAHSRGIGSENLDVPQAAFVEARGPAELLGLLGLHGSLQSHWTHWMFCVANRSRMHTRPMAACNFELTELRKLASQELSKLVSDRTLDFSMSPGPHG